MRRDGTQRGNVALSNDNVRQVRRHRCHSRAMDLQVYGIH